MTPGGGGLGSVFRAFARPGEDHAEQARQVANALARRNVRDRVKHGSEVPHCIGVPRPYAALSGSVRSADAGSTAVAARIRTLALRTGAALEPPPSEDLGQLGQDEPIGMQRRARPGLAGRGPQTPPPPPPARLAPPARPSGDTTPCKVTPTLSLKQAPKDRSKATPPTVVPRAIRPAPRRSPRAGRSPRTPCSPARRGSLVDCVSPLWGFGVAE